MNNNRTKKIALCYDFDGTLSPKYMQHVRLLPELGFDDPDVFWDEVNHNARIQNMDSTLAYMNLALEKAKIKGISLTPRFLMECGKDLTLYKGVDTWFTRLNAYAKEQGIDLEHYIISSGNEEIIRGCKIKKYCKHIFGSKFSYRKEGSSLVAEKPATAVNYTNKTQFLFRINRGIFTYWQNEELNQYMPKEEKYINFTNMVYLGDGETDVPCMKMVLFQGGCSIAVYNPEDEHSIHTVKELYKRDRVNFIAPTDYTENSKLDRIVKNIIDRIALKSVDELP